MKASWTSVLSMWGKSFFPAGPLCVLARFLSSSCHFILIGLKTAQSSGCRWWVRWAGSLSKSTLFVLAAQQGQETSVKNAHQTRLGCLAETFSWTSLRMRCFHPATGARVVCCSSFLSRPCKGLHLCKQCREGGRDFPLADPTQFTVICSLPEPPTLWFTLLAPTSGKDSLSLDQ